MDWLLVLGLVAAVFTTSAGIPQLIKAIKTKSTKDLSLGMFIILSIGVLLWLIYGLGPEEVTLDEHLDVVSTISKPKLFLVAIGSLMVWIGLLATAILRSWQPFGVWMIAVGVLIEFTYVIFSFWRDRWVVEGAHTVPGTVALVVIGTAILSILFSLSGVINFRDVFGRANPATPQYY